MNYTENQIQWIEDNNIACDDVVKIREMKEDEEWVTGWTEEMNEVIGSYGIVCGYGINGVILRTNIGREYFPYFVLEKIDNYDSYLTKYNGEYNLFGQRLKKAGFTKEQLIILDDILSNVCHHCFDEEFGCQCWNDE